MVDHSAAMGLGLGGAVPPPPAAEPASAATIPPFTYPTHPYDSKLHHPPRTKSIFPSWISWSHPKSDPLLALATTPRPLPIPSPATPDPSKPAPAMTFATLAPTPIPMDYNAMPWHMQRHYKKMWKDEMKAIRAWEKSQHEAMRAQEIERMKMEREARKQAREEEKYRKKILKWQSKHPLAGRQMPYIPYDPSTYPMSPAAGGYDPYAGMMDWSTMTMPMTMTMPTHSATPSPAIPVPGPIDHWVMAPTLEEFGVRRPLNAPMEEKGPTIGGVQWPMMSRTMTHAMTDIAREENLYRMQAGQRMPGAPGW